MDFLPISGCETFQDRISPKPIEKDIERMCMKFLASNVDFNGPSLDFIG